MTTRRTLICCAHPFGYGPAAKLLHIAGLLRETDVRLVFVGTGIAHELAARSDLFQEVVNAQPTEASVRDLIAGSAGLLSLMDRTFAPLAVDAGVPLFVVDSLLWMRESVPEVFRQARRYWAQEFVGVRFRLAEVGPQAVLVGPIVGPIVGPAFPIATEDCAGLIVNLGGGASPEGLLSDDPGYLDFLARALRQHVRRESAGVLLAGRDCIHYLRSHFPDWRVDMRSASHGEAVELMQRADRVLSAPGLTATLECFHAGVPTFFLPPQNYSQWWILNRLRERGLAPGSFHWQDVLADGAVQEQAPEAERGQGVRTAIRAALQDVRAERLLGDGLAAITRVDAEDLVRRQSAFYRSLGPEGAQQIAAELVQTL